MEILITGGAGELGSCLTKEFLNMGFKVKIMEIVPKEFAWRLKEVVDNVEYVWKSVHDITLKDLEGVDIIIQCDAQPDRPLGISSPTFTLYHNLESPMKLLETVAKLKKKPWVLYPGSGTIFLGVPYEEQPITEETQPRPTNAYSWSKWAAEELHRTYSRKYNIPSTITRSGFVYGPGARLDISIMKWILRALKNKDLYVRSPEASRTPCYAPDVIQAWKRLIEKGINDLESVNGLTLHFVDSKEYLMKEIANIVVTTLNSDSKIIPVEYEIGEFVNGKPVRQWEKNVLAKKILGWEAKTKLKDGIKNVAKWLQESKIWLL